MNRLAVVPLMLGLALASACSKPDNGASGSTTGSPASSASSGDCDMQGMDMSKMSPEEHQKMMEKCPGAGGSP